MKDWYNSKISFACCGGAFDVEDKKKRIDELVAITAKPDFWNDADKAQEILKEQSLLRESVGDYDKCNSSLEEARFFLELAE